MVVSNTEDETWIAELVFCFVWASWEPLSPWRHRLPRPPSPTYQEER